MSYQLKSEADARFPYLLANEQRDHKAWAKRIMYREERGDKELSAIQVQFAKQAMNEQDQPLTKGK